jgi:signal transduction histidine kinase
MSAPAPQQPDPTPERQVATRTEELSELLAHLSACWDEERRQLARQLHDSLGSSMTALTMHLALLTQHLPAENTALRERAAQMKQLLANIIETNRAMQLKLWNDKLEFLGLKAALNELVSEFKHEHHLLARLSLPDEEASYPRAHKLALLRGAEEGLRNVAAHARASEVDVILDDDGEQVVLTVRDNGVGPGSATPAQFGCHGLRLLRERVRALGGTLSLAAASDGGTALTLTLPSAAGA